jgi:hypothetical protein
VSPNAPSAPLFGLQHRVILAGGRREDQGNRPSSNKITLAESPNVSHQPVLIGSIQSKATVVTLRSRHVVYLLQPARPSY